VTEEMVTLQIDLQASIAAHRAAEQRVTEAVSANNATNASHNATKKELENSEQALYLARERLGGMEAELQETRKQLESNRSVHDAVNYSHTKARQQLRSMLLEASYELNHTRDALQSHRNQNVVQSRSHWHEKRSLVGEIAYFEKKWKNEQGSHNATKLRLKQKQEAADEARSWLNVTLVALVLFVTICSGCVCFLILREKKWRDLALSRASDLGAQVVLGRPVGAEGHVIEVNEVLKTATPVKPGHPPNSKVAWLNADKGSPPVPPSHSLQLCVAD